MSLSNLRTLMRTPPSYCQCAGACCDQAFDVHIPSKGVFLYPSEPEIIAATIEGAVTVLRHAESSATWRTWRDFRVQGQVVFCEICRQMRFTDVVFADVTTLNFNVLFEIGFALGLGLPVVPIRDASYIKHKIEFEELGLIDTLGYLDFQNANDLSTRVRSGMPYKALGAVPTTSNLRQPLYVIKGHLETEGEVRLMSLLKKSSLRFRVFDVRETPRLSLHEARRQVSSSLGVVAHLLDPNRQGSVVNNARCALIAGMATALERSVLLLQEGRTMQPIDYRDLVTVYSNPNQLERTLEPFIRRVVGKLQDAEDTKVVKPTQKLLEQLSLGDVAAENEIVALKSYFVRTAQYHEAKRGSARLVIGRKGAGKTAIFYAVRHAIPDTNAHLVLDLKPEGYQFAKLRERVLEEMTFGMQEHTMVAFWEFILLCEIAQKIVDRDYSWAQREQERRKRFGAVNELHLAHFPGETGDFSERLLGQIDRLVERFAERGEEDVESHRFTGELFRREIRDLEAVIVPYLREKDSVWILVDNLDKGWPTRGAAPADIVIIRALLDATRKLQRQFEQRGLELNVLVFLRNDIYDLLVRNTSDRGKDTQISLDWNDPEVFKEVVRQRIITSTGGRGSFDDVWRTLFDAQVGVADSFSYILDRTLMRPRDLLSFLHRAVETAINRGHERVTEEDIRAAERSYSEDMLLGMSFELRDIYSDYGNLLYAFSRQPATLDAAAVRGVLAPEVDDDKVEAVLEMLLWFGFLGVREQGELEAVYSYQVRYNVDKLLAASRRDESRFEIHPAFHRALDTAES